MPNEKKTIEIHGRPWEWSYVEEGIADCKLSKWQEQKWSPRDALVHRNGGRVSLYVGQKYDADKIDLVEGAWTHDHCQICWWALSEVEDGEHGIGYTNGDGWLCTECYTKFIAPVQEEGKRK